MSRTVAVVVLVIAVLAAAAGGYWFGTRGAGQSERAPATAGARGAGPAAPAGMPVTVEATKVVESPMPQTITAVGSLRSDESVTLRPESAGRISAITFKEGAHVAKGTPLVRLDPAIPEAEVAQARANLTLAKAKFDRAVDLANRNYISGQARDEAENNFKVAQAAVQLAEAKLAKTQIVAPFSGIIGLRSVSVGDYVKEGADLVNLEAIDPLKVDFRVPETYLRQVQPGQSMQITLDALPGKTYAGKIMALNPLVDAAGRSIVIRAQVANQDTTLRPGMFARVRLITSDDAKALVVPEQALVPQGTEQYVFKIVEGKSQRVQVEVGQRRDALVEIRKGLAAGDLVVTAGQLKLRDGVPVQVVAAPAPGGAPAAPARGPTGDVQGSSEMSPIAPALAAPKTAASGRLPRS
ncbi:MAG: efflux RND transporter periplasmic adaptor subunit [Burkholderiales bacterium]|nr:efflux RND transporter periplasmic adaptor subunit [Burkholderiales bacterium]